MKRVIVPALMLFLFVSLPAAGAVGRDDILGFWNTEEKDAIIEILRCGEKYCGRIAWLKEPNYTAEDKNGKTGQPRVDENNPNAGLRKMPLVGLQIMSGFLFEGGDTWKDGRIYDPERGKTYSGEMVLSSPDRLDLRGYAVIPLFGRTTVWTRTGSSGK